MSNDLLRFASAEVKTTNKGVVAAAVAAAVVVLFNSPDVAPSSNYFFPFRHVTPQS